MALASEPASPGRAGGDEKGEAESERREVGAREARVVRSTQSPSQTREARLPEGEGEGKAPEATGRDGQRPARAVTRPCQARPGASRCAEARAPRAALTWCRRASRPAGRRLEPQEANQGPKVCSAPQRRGQARGSLGAARTFHLRGQSSFCRGDTGCSARGRYGRGWGLRAPSASGRPASRAGHGSPSPGPRTCRPWPSPATPTRSCPSSAPRASVQGRGDPERPRVPPRTGAPAPLPARGPSC